MVSKEEACDLRKHEPGLWVKGCFKTKLSSCSHCKAWLSPELRKAELGSTELVSPWPSSFGCISCLASLWVLGMKDVPVRPTPARKGTLSLSGPH